MPTIKRTKVEYEGKVEEREVIIEEEHVSPWDASARLRIVGQELTRIDGAARVTGQARYTCDVAPPGALVGRIKRSPHPHARIQSVDSRAAEELAGVRLVWHSAALPPITSIEGRDLFAQEIGFQGAEVAFVVADDQRTAEEALARIEIEYEPLPFVHDLAAARADGAPPTWSDVDGNVIEGGAAIYERGDVESGLAAADAVVDITFTTPAAAHCCLETHGSVASWEGDQLTLWHSTQGIFRARETISDALDLPQDKTRVVCAYVGGGFGSKGGAESYSLLAALAARELNRPVRVILDRAEEQLAAGYRPASRQRVRLGARSDGTLTAIVHEGWECMGAFGGGPHPIAGPTNDLYTCANVRSEIRTVRANTDTARAFRAPGYVEGAFALEGALDELAAELDIDPLELRLINYAEDSPQRGTPYTSKRLRQAYVIGAERFGWQERTATARQRGPWRRGWGMASQIWGGGGGPPANAIIKLLPDGTVDVIAGVQDIGTGTKTIIAQVAAEELGLPVKAVRAVVGDTLPAPYGPFSGGSQTLASITPAVRSAARDALRQVLGIAAVMLDLEGAEPEAFDVSEGEITYTADPDRQIPFAKAAAKMDGYTIVGTGARGPNPEDEAVNTFGVQFAEVDVNVETGQVRLLRVTAAHDIGRVINPTTATSQVYGGVIMGVGYATSEERTLDANTGLQLTANLEDYKVPVLHDVPRIDVLFVDEADARANSVGAKGLGEPPIIPTAAAIANAVSDALDTRVTALPLTPDRVLAAWQAKTKEKGQCASPKNPTDARETKEAGESGGER